MKIYHFTQNQPGNQEKQLHVFKLLLLTSINQLIAICPNNKVVNDGFNQIMYPNIDNLKFKSKKKIQTYNMFSW